MDAITIWKKTLDILVSELTEVKYKTFILPIEPTFSNDSLIILTVKDAFSLEQTEPMKSLIENCIEVAIGKKMEVKLELPGSDFTLAKIHEDSFEQMPTVSSNASRLNSNYTFDSFIVGDGNRFAHAACVSVAEGGKQYNPIFLYGGSGLGKTHLMHAVGNYVTKHKPSAKVVYVNCERFVNEFIATIKEQKYDEFRERYRNADYLLIDDIQFLERKEQIQIEFFHTFNDLYDSGSIILMTCDRPPQSLSYLEER